MQALAVVSESHQGPLALDLIEAAQREPGEAEHRLDDAEDRLDGLPAQLVEGPALFARELLGQPSRRSAVQYRLKPQPAELHHNHHQPPLR